MSAYKDEKRNTWFLKFRYKDWTGKTKWVTKRGFSTKREALQWERTFLAQKDGSLDMTFSEFTKIYWNDRCPRLKESTVATKKNIIETKILPFFGNLRLCDITPATVLQWQNTLLLHRDERTNKPYSKTYLKTVHNQLSAIFNHAVRYYGLQSNPAQKAGNIGVEEQREMLFWTKDEYLKFSHAIMDKPISFYAFEMLYWCGIREGELLALTPADFNFQKHTVTINKTYQRLNRRDLITTPKTPKSNRVIYMPQFLCDEIQDYLLQHTDLPADHRLFPISKHSLHSEMNRGCKLSGVKRIRIHDLRHSHISLLIDMGFSALAIADRVGHECIDITYRYAHLFPSKQTEMANQLDTLRTQKEV